jgi:hypothetical protein
LCGGYSSLAATKFTRSDNAAKQIQLQLALKYELRRVYIASDKYLPQTLNIQSFTGKDK